MDDVRTSARAAARVLARAAGVVFVWVGAGGDGVGVSAFLMWGWGRGGGGGDGLSSTADESFSSGGEMLGVVVLSIDSSSLGMEGYVRF